MPRVDLRPRPGPLPWEATLEEAVAKSVSFNTWLESYLEQTGKTKWDFDESELVDKFLDEVLKSSTAEEIARKFAGEDILADDDPNMEDTGEGGGGGRSPFADALADYSNIDIQEILPNGSTEDVKREVLKLLEEVATGGGLILAPSHELQDDIPPENVEVMYRTVLKYGNYHSLESKIK